MSCASCQAENEKWKARWDGYRARGWKEESCGSCRGYGVVPDYGATGTDFYGAKECDECGGGGTVWATPSGKHHAHYPGGPFCD